MITAMQPIKDRLTALDPQASAAHDVLPSMESVTLTLTGREAQALLTAIGWHVYLGVGMSEQVSDGDMEIFGAAGEIDQAVANYSTELDVAAALVAATVQVPESVS